MNNNDFSCYKSLFDNNPLPQLILKDDVSLKILDANQAASELYGYSLPELLEMSFYNLYWENNLNFFGSLSGSTSQMHRKKNGEGVRVDLKSINFIFNDSSAILKTITPVESKPVQDDLGILYSAIIESSDDAIIGKTLQGTIISWNHGAEKLYGYKSEEVIGEDISIIAPPDKKSEIAEIMQKLRRGESIEHYETRRQKKNGEIIWVSITVSPVKDSTGRIIGASAIARNITKTKEDLAQLNENQIIFRHLIDNLSEIFYVSDPRKPQIIYMSEAYEKVFGRPLNSIYNDPSSYINYIFPEDRVKANRAMAKQMNGVVTDYTYRVIREDGGIRHLRERAFPVKDDSGEVFRIIGIAEDITERFESSLELQKREYRYRSIFETSAVAMWEVDFAEVLALIDDLRAGINNFRKYFNDYPEFVQKCFEKVNVVNVNPRTVRLFKAESKNWLIENFKHVKSPEYFSVFFEILVVLANGGHHFEAEFELKTFADEMIYVYAIISFPYENSPYKFTVASVIDITEMKITQRALSESEQRFRIMADTAPVFIWMAGIDKGFYYFNKPWLDFTGKHISDEIGYGWMKGIHPSDFPVFKETFDSSFDAHKEFSIEYRVKRYDGEYRWILNHGVPRLSSDGTFQGYIGSGMDITIRKINEVELSAALTREQNALFNAEHVKKNLELLAQASNTLNSSLNYTQTVKPLARLLTPSVCDWFIADVFENDLVQRLFVFNDNPARQDYAKELQIKFPLNSDARGGVHNVIRTGMTEVYNELSEDQIGNFEADEGMTRILREQGVKSVMIVPLRLHSKMLGALTFCTVQQGKIYDEEDLKFASDIAFRTATAIENAGLFKRIAELNKNLAQTIKKQEDEIKIRKAIDKELRESEERFRLITENSNDFISLVDENDIFLYANPAITGVLGYDKSELVGKINIKDLIHPDDRGKGGAVNGHSILELRFRRKDGAFIWVESSSLKVNYHGKKVAIRISRDITERKRIENERIRLYAELESQRLRVDNLIANVPGVVWEAWGDAGTPNRKMDFISDYVEKLLGYPVMEWLNTPDFWLKTIHPDDRENALSEARKNYIDIKGGISRFRWIAKDGSEIWIESQSTCICDGEGSVIGMRGVNMDITEQIKFEQQISASLKEKEILLKEIHHRVKNNMQVISSLLSLQSKNIPDKHSQELFNESRNRIRSMALIHEKLYQSKNFFSIDFRSYVVDLINNLIISFGMARQNILTKINIENIRFDIDSAITLGLIINELATNSFKHAFKGRMRGNFEIAIIKEQNNYILTIKDDGIGIPKNLEEKKNESLGLQLVDTLVEQIYGNYRILSKGGTEVTIEFPDPSLEAEERVEMNRSQQSA